jgi:hypothetical protein
MKKRERQITEFPENNKGLRFVHPRVDGSGDIVFSLTNACLIKL